MTANQFTTDDRDDDDRPVHEIWARIVNDSTDCEPTDDGFEQNLQALHFANRGRR